MIGVDIINVSRFAKILKSDFPFWDKFYKKSEWDYSFRRANCYEHLAGIFAAKEAIIKADSKKTLKFHHQIEINHKPNGCPYAKFAIPFYKQVSISISHDANLAVAVALVQ